MIQQLIDKSDNFEVIRDQVAAILKLEIANQKILATATTSDGSSAMYDASRVAQDGGAPRDPSQWDLKIYEERSNPWEAYLNNSDPSVPPIVNVWYDTSAVDTTASNRIERQKVTTTINIDCYARGVARSNGTGHVAGDHDAALNSQRAARLVRNILMASEYTYLQLQGVVWGRWVQSIASFQPQFDANNVQQVVATRLQLVVTHNEVSPQYVGEPLCLLSLQVLRAEDGEILIAADYEYNQ